MNTTSIKTPLRHAVLSLLAAVCLIPTSLRAADHGDAPTLAHDQAADLADLYFFRDPSDNSRAVLIGTFRGFIVPGENANFAVFDPAIRYVFEIYNKHVNLEKEDVVARKIAPTKTITVTFSKRLGGTDPTADSLPALQIPFPQTATFQFTGFDGIRKRDKFTAPCLNPSVGPSSPSQAAVVTDLPDAATGIKVFVGEVDDPFFFDIPAFSRFVASIRNAPHTPDFTQFNRGRDSFAGYNILAIAISVPLAMLNEDNQKYIGADFLSQRHQVEQPTRTGEVKGIGTFRTVDRIANPAVNVALIPFSRKNEYNAAKPKDDAAGKFVGAAEGKPLGIVDTLTAFGTNGTYIGALADVAVTWGDVLKLDTTVANSGTNPEAAFPNGRRLNDDVVDALLFFVTNTAYAPQTGMTAGGDNVLENDKTFGATFPFLAPTHQPLNAGDTDGTEN